MLLERDFANQGLNRSLTSELTLPETMEPALRLSDYHKLVHILPQLLPRSPCCWLDKMKPTGVPRGEARRFKPPMNVHIFWILCLHKKCPSSAHVFMKSKNSAQENVKNCTLISHFASDYGWQSIKTPTGTTHFHPQTPGSAPFRHFLIHPLWSSSIAKSWLRLWWNPSQTSCEFMTINEV